MQRILKDIRSCTVCAKSLALLTTVLVASSSSAAVYARFDGSTGSRKM
ncbi:MAG: hypothetical protein ACI9TH_002663 [Kiritimatiellia bacterium]|jgi:hypothetical protein